MSGGSWDYLYSKVEEAAFRLKAEGDPLRKAFGAHIQQVAKALHDIEWVDSCDMDKGDEVEAIRAVVSPALEAAAVKAELEALLVRADMALERLDRS